MAVIAIDARPLANQMDGISRYTAEIFNCLMQEEQHEWLLYSHRPLNAFNESARVRTPASNLNSILVSQTYFSRWLEQDKVDVFWSPRHHLPIVRTRCRMVVTIHDVAWKLYPATMPGKRRFLEALLTPMSLARADAVLTVSESTQQDVTGIWPQYADKISVAAPGAKNFRLSEKSPLDSRYILAVATIEPRKNYALLLEGFAQIVNSIPHNLVIIGRPGWGGINLTKMIADFGLENRVIWHAGSTDEQLGDYYKHAEFLVSTSLYEGFNLPLLEAISAGTPILATDISIHREVAGNAGSFFAPNRVDFTHSLKQITSDEAFRKQLAANCRIRAESFSWKSAARTTLDTLLSNPNS